MLATVEELLMIQAFARPSYGEAAGGVQASTAYVMRWTMA
jgi:hypothetical protein